MSQWKEKRLGSIGVASDVQYANIPIGSNFAGTSRRFYRDSLKALKQSCSHWKEQFETHPLHFIAHLCDLIDGQAKGDSGKGGPVALNSITKALKPFEKNFPHIPIYHCIGNHELYCFSKQELLPILFSASSSSPMTSSPSSPSLSSLSSSFSSSLNIATSASNTNAT